MKYKDREDNILDILLHNLKQNNDKEELLCNYKICSQCRGECCKKSGCHISPDDLKKIDNRTINKLLDAGLVVIDWWVGYENKSLDVYLDEVYYLKIAHIGSPPISNGIGGRCTLLTYKGCPISFKYRPKGARRLNCHKLNINKDTPHYNIEECLQDWLPYQDILESIVINRERGKK